MSTRRLLDRFPQSKAWGEDVTVIAPGMVFKGEIDSPSIIVVAGRVDGTLRAGKLVHVVHGAAVRGPIFAGSVLVEGAVDGDVEVEDQFELGRSGRVRGNVVGPRVAVAEGAYLKGTVRAAEGRVRKFREKRG